MADADIPAPPQTKRGPKPKPESIEATRYVIEGGWNCNQAAMHFGIDPAGLRRRVNRILRNKRQINATPASE